MEPSDGGFVDAGPDHACPHMSGWIADQSITAGGNPHDNDRFRPAHVVTAVQEAAFLCRRLIE